MQIYHIIHGAGSVVMTDQSSFSATFGGQEMMFDLSGRVAGSPVTSTKVAGLNRPLIAWPANGESLAGLQSLVNAALDYKRGVGQ
jgi:hypothetical protein